MAAHVLAALLFAMGAENPLKVLRRDWAALNMRSTARHLLRPPSKAGYAQCAELKQQVAAGVLEGEFVVEAFARACREHSLDEETRVRDGLLGTRMRQGWVRDDTLDRACFVAPLGQVTGPIETPYGWHLVLVEERIGCRFDNGMTRVVPREVSGATRGEGGGDAPFVRSALDEGDADAAQRELWLGAGKAVAATGALWLGANVLAQGAAQVVDQVLESS